MSESVSFRAFVEESNVTPLPSRRAVVAKYIPGLYHVIHDKMVSSIANINSVALTSDVWTNCALQSFISVTYHYIDEQWILKNACLDVIPLLEYRHIASNLAAVVRNRAYQTLGEHTIIASIVTDGASVMKVCFIDDDLNET